MGSKKLELGGGGGGRVMNGWTDGWTEGRLRDGDGGTEGRKDGGTEGRRDGREG